MMPVNDSDAPAAPGELVLPIGNIARSAAIVASGPVVAPKGTGRKLGGRTWSAQEGKDLLKTCADLKITDDTPISDAR